MRRRWLRAWPVAVVVVATVVVIAVHVIAERITREPPNYSRIEDGLWLGGNLAEPPPGTQAVLNLCESADRYHVESERWAPIRDAEPVPSLEWLREQVQFIETERATGRVVYVHCQNGVSRSGMVVVAYYMARNSWSRDEAMEFVKSRRPGLRPNPAFMRLLSEWEQSLKDKGGREEPARAPDRGGGK